eukprot:9501386-Lingulodinium_polyedra.AAC.1
MDLRAKEWLAKWSKKVPGHAKAVRAAIVRTRRRALDQRREAEGARAEACDKGNGSPGLELLAEDGREP